MLCYLFSIWCSAHTPASMDEVILQDFGWSVIPNATVSGERLWECVHSAKIYDPRSRKTYYGSVEDYTYYTQPEQCPPPDWELAYWRKTRAATRAHR